MRKVLATILFLLFVSATVIGPNFTPAPALAQPDASNTYSDPCHSPPGEAIIVDVAVMRPLGFGATLVGLIGAAVAAPFALATGSMDRVAQSLILEPVEYTFKRPVGTFEYDPCNPSTGGGTAMGTPRY